jgi:hypothetical protein
VVPVFTVEMARQFTAQQGLRSPVWSASGRTPVTAFAVTMRVGLSFSDDQLDDDERFVDTDRFEDVLDHFADQLSRTVWTSLFDRRPTFEYVARWLYQQLHAQIPQLAHVTLVNDTIGVSTTYTDPARATCIPQ